MFYVIRDSYTDYGHEIIGTSKEYRNALRKMIKDIKRRSGEDIDVDALVESVYNGAEYENRDIKIYGDGALIAYTCEYTIS